MLKIQNLNVQAEGKPILKNINLTFELGKNYCILGENGSGKSSLAMTIMGHPKYEIKKGEIYVDNENIINISPHKRAQMGIFVAFQHIPEIKGVKLFEFLKAIYDTKNGTHTSFIQFKKIIEPLLAELKIEKEFLWRDINVGFSGGERRKTEMLQIKLLEPKYIFLDEVDSGLDVDAFNDIAQHISEINHGENSLIIITHLFKIVDDLPIDTVYIMQDGEIVKSGDQDLIQVIAREGFKNL